MAIGAGIAAQFGYKSESAWGTAVTPDKFCEFRSEKVKNDGGARIVSKGLKAGRLVHHRAARGIPKIGGPIVMELPNVAVAPLLKHCFGGVSTSGAGPYTHTFTPATLLGVSFTAQVGRPSVDGTVNAFTWAGCKIPEWELAASVNEYVLFTPTISAKSETTATGLASASYGAGLAPFVFTGAALTIAAASIAVNAFTLKGSNGLKADREGPGSSAIREQVADTWREYDGTIDAEFESLTRYADFIAATQRALVLTFTSGSDTLTVTMNVELTGESPEVAGPGILSHPQPYSVISATSDAAGITAVLVNTDTTAA